MKTTVTSTTSLVKPRFVVRKLQRIASVMAAMLCILAGQAQAQGRLTPPKVMTPTGIIGDFGTEIVFQSGTDPNGDPRPSKVFASMEYVGGASLIQRYDSGSGSYYFDAYVYSPGYLIVTGIEHIPDESHPYWNWDLSATFISLQDYLSLGVSVNGFNGVNEDGNYYMVSPVKTYGNPTIWPDTLAIWSPDNVMMCFTGGALYADGTLMETYQGNGPVWTFIRWLGSTPTNNSQIIGSNNPNYGQTVSGLLDTSIWATDAGTATVSVPFTGTTLTLSKSPR